MRGREPLVWIPYVEEGGAIWPLSVLSQEKEEAVFIEDPWMKKKKSETKRDSKLAKEEQEAETSSSEEDEHEVDEADITHSLENSSLEEDSNTESHLEDWFPSVAKNKKLPRISTAGSHYHTQTQESEDSSSRPSTSNSTRKSRKPDRSSTNKVSFKSLSNINSPIMADESSASEMVGYKGSRRSLGKQM